MRAFVIHNDGETFGEVELETPAELARAVGGWAFRENEWTKVDGEVFECPAILNPEFSHLTMWCNENGRIVGLGGNVRASILLGFWDAGAEMLVGDVVVTGPTTDAGDDSGLADQDLAALTKAASNIVVVQHWRERMLRGH